MNSLVCVGCAAWFLDCPLWRTTTAASVWYCCLANQEMMTSYFHWRGGGYGAVLSMLGGVRPLVTAGGGWSIRRCGPALFWRGTLAWCWGSVRDSCLRVNSPEHRINSSPLLPPPPLAPVLDWLRNWCFDATVAASSALLWELMELWHSDPESATARGNPAAIWYTGFWNESGASSWDLPGAVSVLGVVGVWPALLRVGPLGVLPLAVRVVHTPVPWPTEVWLSLMGSLKEVLGALSRERLSCRSTIDKLLLPLGIWTSGSLASE